MNPEGNKNTEDLTKPKNSIGNSFSSALFYLSILFFIIGFNFSDVMVGNWYQQFMPFLNNRPISDITFIDSLNGFAVTGDNTTADTNYILRTTNSGDTWNIINSVYRDLSRVAFINQNTGFICGGFNVVGGYLIKTTNAGLNWEIIPNSNFANHFDDIFTFGEDTIFVADDNGFDGGIFRTTNGGINWQTMYGGPERPNKIYMFNSRIGFFSTSFKTFKTTNSGFNWSEIDALKGFRDIHFVDSLTGWKAYNPFSPDSNMQKTTNGGINWFRQKLPKGGIISNSDMSSFTNINRDTIWGGGGSVLFPNNQPRGTLYKTTNGGETWLFQIPDTSILITGYPIVQFINKNNGWGYLPFQSTGIHTTAGGDTTFYTGIQQTSSNIPKEFELKQNYPNPFNPRTVIPYKLKKSAFVRLIVYEITGKETQIMVNQLQQAGEYEVDFMGKFNSSGVYFYSLNIDGIIIDTRKMILIK